MLYADKDAHTRVFSVFLYSQKMLSTSLMGIISVLYIYI